MFCEKCGKELSKDMIFCDKCGAKNNNISDTEKSVSINDVSKSNFTNINGTSTQTNDKTKSGCFANLIKALVILVIIAAIFHSCTGGDKNPTKNADTTTQTANTNKEIDYKIGNPLKTDKLEITINSVEEKSEIGGEFSKKSPAQGGVYIAVQYQFKNISNEPISSFSEPKINLIDKNNTKYNSDLGASMAYAGKSDTKIISDLNPGITVKNYKVYEISRELFEKGGWKVLVSYKDQTFKVDINSNSQTNNTKTTEEKQNVEQVKEPEEGAPDYVTWDMITASSELPPSESSYTPSNVTDWNNSTAWVEGVDGDGLNEWIKLESSFNTSISGIEIVNGYQKSENIYNFNNRPKKILLEFSNGTSMEKELTDNFGKNNQILFGEKIKTKYIKITILDVYKGSKYQDTCISEIHAYK